MRNKEGLFVRQEAYRDFDVAFRINPINSDIISLNTVDSIKQSVKLLVLTSFYERPYKPRIGTRLAGSLFELYDLDMISSIKNEIKEVIKTYESRVVVQDVIVQSPEESLDSNSINVRVEYLIVGKVGIIQQQILLKRIR